MRVLLPLPDRDFDVTEVAVPRHILTAGAFLLTGWRLGRYYRTYPAYVQDEVRAALDSPVQFERGPRVLAARGTQADDSAAFVVQDGNYLSARWPGDAYLFGRRFLAMLEGGPPGGHA